MVSVDVIILSWDRLEDTLEAIRSALSQQGVELRVIVVDQGSKPESLKQLRAFCETEDKVTLICNRDNSGVPGGRNQASFAGDSKYIVALDNDAVFLDDSQLATMVEIMEAEPKLGVLAFRIKIFGGEGDDKSSWSYSESMAEFAGQRFKTVRFVGAGHAIRRLAFEKIGGYDDKLFFLHEEVDLAKRIINAGYEIAYDPRVTIRHKVSAEHRVSWSGKRYYFDVRNKTYLHVKHRTKLPTLLFHTGLMVMQGVRSGFGWPTMKGMFGAFGMLPLALRQRLHDPYVRKTRSSAAYMESCSPTRGMSAMERIRMRVQHANKKVGA